MAKRVKCEQSGVEVYAVLDSDMRRKQKAYFKCASCGLPLFIEAKDGTVTVPEHGRIV